ncbi:MAG: 23S rRNA (adenine(2503)-C(2))-methyltransferase RlmN [Gemmatimonadetes bacterium]|nr:23S rRNA (adenine(2503)-C(2))-methyltransferase RlmN [Gemmatimonadota bacterium]NNM07107.1 23S rRNA (adenine(2503)-C(2))-methyltransferase RlmN [Gemmatimonadota bacterium]
MEKGLDILGLTPIELDSELEAHFQKRGQPKYRAHQVREWIFDGLALGFGDMTNLPVKERHALAGPFVMEEPVVASIARSKDGTVKHLWHLRDGELVESVLIPTEDRLTLCISSQAGCGMGCTFCATGFGGLRRNLTSAEIVAQYRASQRWAFDEGKGRIGNIVFMGMGEPLANRKGLFPALTILNQGYGVGARRITVSTVGLVPGILDLAERPEQFRLALSLHAPTSELRRTLIPLEDRYSLAEVLGALRVFDEAGGKRITFEYTLINGVNDHEHLAPQLADLAAGLQAFVNLIPFNPIPYQDWEPSPPDRVRTFAKAIEERGVPVAVREPRGRDIDAACGQLRASAITEEEPQADAGVT